MAGWDDIGQPVDATAAVLTPPASSPSVDDIATRIASIESGGKYDALGPATSSGDRAHGKYQIMGANIPSWTKDALGASMTPTDFLKNPDAQEKTAKHQLSKYLAQYGNPRDVASMWHAGVPYDKAVTEGRQDALGTKTKDYADRVANGEPSAGTGASWDSVGTPDTTGAPVASTTTSTTTTSPPPQGKSPREMTVDEAAAAINKGFGLDEGHMVGKYTASLGKPVTDALQDLFEVVANPPTPGSADMGTAFTDALKAMHPLAVPGEAAGNVVEQAATQAGVPPKYAKIINTLTSLVVGAKTPIPGVGAGSTVETPLQGTAATRAAAQEAEAAASSATTQAGAVKAAGEAATTSATQEAEAAAQAAESAVAKTTPSIEAGTSAKSALTPAGVTAEQGGQAIQAGLSKKLDEIKDPVQGIYEAVAANNVGKGIDPAKYKTISDSLDAVQQELGPTLTGQAKQVIADLKAKIDTAQKLTYEDLNTYKSQLDTLFPGKTPLGATPKTSALYQLKWDVRNMMHEVVEGDDKSWLNVANSMWRDEVIPRQKLVTLVKKTDPMTVVERLFGNGTSDKQAAMARTVMKDLGDDPGGAGEAVRQALFARMIDKASSADKVLDKSKLLKSYDAFNDTFRTAMMNPGAKAFFDVLRDEEVTAASTASVAKSAGATAKAVGKAAETATSEAEKVATTATKAAESAKATATAPNRLARFTARGLQLGGGAAADAVLHQLGIHDAGIGTMAGVLLPSTTIAKMLANSKTANLMARSLKTPMNSAVMPVLLQQMHKAGIIGTMP